MLTRDACFDVRLSAAQHNSLGTGGGGATGSKYKRIGCAGGAQPQSPAKRAKLSVFLLTSDDALWPQIGALVPGDLLLKHVDTIDELLAAMAPEQACIALLDARDQLNAAAVLSRLALHSARIAVVVLEAGNGATEWASAIPGQQVAAHVTLPILAAPLLAALMSAEEEVNARVALLGEGLGQAPGLGTSPGKSPETGRRSLPWLAPSLITVLVIIAAVGAVLVLRPGATAGTSAPLSKIERAVLTPADADEKIDLLIEKAEQAMRARHFIDPAEGSALTLYRNALVLDAKNGEAQQGLQRLAEVLFARTQLALDERKYDSALQALEIARTIDPTDSRLATLDERIAGSRAEFGPTQILAAINAQNFAHATQLIDEAARTKSLNAVKLAQLRDELQRRKQDVEAANFVKLIDTRLQQDKLIEPRNDSAAYYLGQARAAGVSTAALQQQAQEMFRRLAQSGHAAIEQRRFTEADRVLADLHAIGAPASAVAALQHDLASARSPQSAAVSAAPQYLDLAQPGPAEALPQPTGPGVTAEVNALNLRLAQTKLAAADVPEVLESSLTRIRGLQLDYPPLAQLKGVEGWVDVSYVVTPQGRVTAVKVLDSSPKGTFDDAATRALGRMRYASGRGGQATAVGTKLRISFRIDSSVR